MPDSISPEYMAFLEREAADLNSKREEFFSRYGFYHDCHCDTDYAEDKTMYVPECWVEMMDTSFDRLAQYRMFLYDLAADASAFSGEDISNRINDFLYAGRS